MSAEPSTAEKNGVILIRQGVGREEYALPEGATLGDLLREAELNRHDQEIFINGKLLEDTLVLPQGVIVSVVPRPRIASITGSCWEGVGMFHDDPTFKELCDSVEASREAEKDRS